MAGQSLPLPGVKIEIYDAGTNTLIGTYLTNPEGKTVEITADVPDMDLSLTPEMEIPFGKFNILATSKGFYSVTVKDAQIFSDRTSLQYINMIPLPQGVGDGENIFVVPNQNL